MYIHTYILLLLLLLIVIVLILLLLLLLLIIMITIIMIMMITGGMTRKTAAPGAIPVRPPPGQNVNKYKLGLFLRPLGKDL